mgnify:CR=1 FL=1
MSTAGVSSSVAVMNSAASLRGRKKSVSGCGRSATSATVPEIEAVAAELLGAGVELVSTGNTATAIEAAGLLDEGYFMYSEELDLCRRVKEAGWQIVYLPEAQVVHYVGKSSEQAVAARHIYFQTSKVHYFRKWHGAFPATCLRVFLLSQYLWQIGLEGVKGLLGSKRELRKQRVKVYAQVLRTGLK